MRPQQRDGGVTRTEAGREGVEDRSKRALSRGGRLNSVVELEGQSKFVDARSDGGVSPTQEGRASYVDTVANEGKAV